MKCAFVNHMDHVPPQAFVPLPTCFHWDLVDPQRDYIPLLSDYLHLRFCTSPLNHSCLFFSLTFTGTNPMHGWIPTAFSMHSPYILRVLGINYITEQVDILIHSRSPWAIGFSILLHDLTEFLQVFSYFYHISRPNQLPFCHWTIARSHLHYTSPMPPSQQFSEYVSVLFGGHLNILPWNILYRVLLCKFVISQEQVLLLFFCLYSLLSPRNWSCYTVRHKCKFVKCTREQMNTKYWAFISNSTVISWKLTHLSLHKQVLSFNNILFSNRRLKISIRRRISRQL